MTYDGNETVSLYRPPNIVRSDGTLWVSSYRSEGSAMAALFDSSLPQLFLRQVERNPARRWLTWWRPEWRYTGETWEGRYLADGGFDIATHIERE